MEITNNIKYIGVYDEDIRIFEGQYPVSKGISYNSYLIKDKFNALLDTCDERVIDKWLKNLEDELGSDNLDYIIVSHLEPDHSAGLKEVATKYKNAKIYMTLKASQMLDLFLDIDLKNRIVTVKEGDSLNLGEHNLKFIMAPMIHWPEVMFSYEETSKTLFSADAFGRFGDINELTPYEDEAVRYYTNIVGKYGNQVKNILTKASTLEISRICPLHGPILNNNLSYYINLYLKLASYESLKPGVLVAYASMHGKTKEAALYLKDLLDKENIENKIINLVEDDLSYGVGYAFTYLNIIILSPTYDGDIFSYTKDFLNRLKAKNVLGKKISLIENGAWAPISNKLISDFINNNLKNITINETLTIKVGMTQTNKEEFKTLVSSLK